uniref:Uncharacterized protein n=1 Tax=Amphimedon queenslandica TaxID=400682 RepID=A0A1X7UXZ3_AMPQE
FLKAIALMKSTISKTTTTTTTIIIIKHST